MRKEPERLGSDLIALVFIIIVRLNSVAILFDSWMYIGDIL
jgi:hypothetical protein